jgi:hypothetical protein
MRLKSAAECLDSVGAFAVPIWSGASNTSQTLLRFQELALNLGASQVRVNTDDVQLCHP